MKRKHLFEMMLVFLLVMMAYGYFSSLADWNTNSRMSLVKAVVEEKRFEIDSYQNLYGLITQDKAKFGGHFYSDKAIGSSLLGIVFYGPLYFFSNFAGSVMELRVFKELITFLAISLICAFLAPLMYSFAKQISNRPRFALLITAVICLGTPFYKYSTVYYGHSLVGLFLFVAFFIWFHIKAEENISLVKTLISGYFLGYAIITEYPVALIVFGIGLYILYVLWKKQRLFDWKVSGCLVLGVALPILLAMGYNVAVFGGPLKTGYGFEAMSIFAEGQSGGLMGIGWPSLHTLFYMTFHTTMGIFWQCPVLLFAFVGWFRMWQGIRYRAEAALSFGVVAVYFLLMSGYYLWWGGGAFTPRSLIPVYPFFVIPLIFLTGRFEKALMIIFAFISLAQMFMVVSASSEGLYLISDNMAITSIHSMFQQPSMIYNVYAPNFINQILEINRGQEFFQLNGFQSLIPLLVVELLILAAFIKTTSKAQ